MKKSVFKPRLFKWLCLPIALTLIFVYILLQGKTFFYINSNQSVEAATPAAGSLTDTVGSTITWLGDRTGSPPAANGEDSCTAGDATATNCDVFTLNIPPGNWSGKIIRVRFQWATVANDYDMVVRQETNGTPGMQGACVSGCTGTLDAVVATSGQGTTNFEEVILGPPNDGAVYYIRAVYFAAVGPADQYLGKATVESIPVSVPPPSACPLPTFDNYQPPVGFPRRDQSGEPSIGVNWNTGNILTMSRLQANRTSFDDSTSPADPINGVKWMGKTSPALVTGFDPILFIDSVTGRTIAGELEIAAGSTNGLISDDDLTTILATFQTGGATQGVDHQTIGGGPPNPNISGRQPTGRYPHLFYYASQSIATATVATSFDGGLTYEPAVPAYTLAQCGGLHGHIKVAPNDGTVYLPNKGCGGKQGFAVSTDNGLTWTVRTVPTSTAGRTDPSVGIGSGGRVYFAYTAGDNHPHVVVSDDKGITWRNDYDLALAVSPNLTAAVFPAVVAGDNDRAAVFFIATDSTNPGNPVGDDSGTAYKGTWYPYIAVTCDGGQSWSVIRADNDPLNPGKPNPVQQGVICTSGTTCPTGTRNLLDFNDMTVDSRGRILAVYADGCNFGHPCINITDNSADKSQNQGIARLTIIRQRGGMRLFSAFDPGGPAPTPLSPPVYVASTQRGNKLKWPTPDDGGAPIISYRIYRGSDRQGETLIAEVKSNVHEFIDRKSRGAGNYYYRVTAVNAYGESPSNLRFYPMKENE